MTGSAMVVMYGCSPVVDYEPPWPPPLPQTNPWWPGALPKRFEHVEPIIPMAPCDKCNRHVRSGEPCPFCMKAAIEKLERRVDELIEREQAPAPKPAKRAKRKKSKR